MERGTLTAKRKLDKLWKNDFVSLNTFKDSASLFNPYDLPQHWLSDYPKPQKYHEGSDRGATDEGW
jgi:hypothetical protein